MCRSPLLYRVYAIVFMIAELTLTVVANTYFQVLDEAPATGSYRADSSTGGPWDASLQHGGPPNALLIHAAERLAAAETGRTDLVALRLAAEFVGPVPVGDVVATARIV